MQKEMPHATTDSERHDGGRLQIGVLRVDRYEIKVGLESIEAQGNENIHHYNVI